MFGGGSRVVLVLFRGGRGRTSKFVRSSQLGELGWTLRRMGEDLLPLTSLRVEDQTLAFFCLFSPRNVRRECASRFVVVTFEGAVLDLGSRA